MKNDSLYLTKSSQSNRLKSYLAMTTQQLDNLLTTRNSSSFYKTDIDFKPKSIIPNAKYISFQKGDNKPRRHSLSSTHLRRNDLNINEEKMNYSTMLPNIINNNLGYENENMDNYIDILVKENSELKNDINKLFQITDQNKEDLQLKINELIKENNKLKKENAVLKNQLINQNKDYNILQVEKEQMKNDFKVHRSNYLDEIRELNCVLNNYKLKLSYLNKDFNKLLTDYHNLKQRNLLYSTNDNYFY